MIPAANEVVVSDLHKAFDGKPVLTGVDLSVRRGEMVARQATAEEKATFWPLAVAAWPAYDDYQAATDRDIPLMICERV